MPALLRPAPKPGLKKSETPLPNWVSSLLIQEELYHVFLIGFIQDSFFRVIPGKRFGMARSWPVPGQREVIRLTQRGLSLDGSSAPAI